MAKEQAPAKDPDNAAIARARQLAEPPMPVLLRKTAHVVAPGDKVLRPNLRNGSFWYVVALSDNGFRALVTDHKYGTVAERNDCVKEWVPVDCLQPFVPGVTERQPDKPKPAAPAPDKPLRRAAEKQPLSTAPKVTPPKDDIAFRLSQADTLDELWKIAFDMGLPKELRAKLAHLNPGLQRMNIGNRLRKLPK